MSKDSLINRLFGSLSEIPILDPHTHINPLRPTAKTLDDLLGYHYYTELAHSAGMSHEPLRQEVDPLERTRAILTYAERYDNTVQYSWLLEIAQTFFGWGGDRLTALDTEFLWKTAEKKLQQPDWEEQVLKQSRVEQVFLTNDFDDPLEGFDAARYVPCLRVDDLVFHLEEPLIRERIARATGLDITDASRIGAAFQLLFERFVGKGAKACAISLPPQYVHEPKSVGSVGWFLEQIAICCRDWKLPFDLMIGVNRRVYFGGVYQGQDLFDQRTSLIQFAGLFNAFPEVNFCVSVLTSGQNQELSSYSWIFPNVITCGHWWYANVPTLIERDLRNRLQCVPKTKQIGYYSDAYKLEFILPKFNMYRRALAKVLGEEYVLERNWSEERAVELGETILRGNSEKVFFGKEV